MTELDVLLDGARCGRVAQSASGNLSFTYDAEYRLSPLATPLSLSMPLAGAVHKKRVVLPFLQGLLPDSEEALRAIGRRFAANPANPFALLQHVGSEVAGAVQLVEPGTSGSDATAGRTCVRPVSDDEVAAMLEHVVSEYSDGISNDDAVGRFSLAGAQPKIALHRLMDGTWAVPEDATPTTHILKPVTGAVRQIDVVEQMTMRAAAFLGNDVASSALMTIGGRDVFVTERYDRSVVDGRWVRLHQEDLCQSLGVSPSKKYQHRDGGPGLAAVARLIRSLPLEADRSAVGLDFYRAFVFNVVAAGTDAHAKNYSVLLDNRSVRLAPLYDLITFAPFWNGTSRLDSAMSVDGEYSLERISASSLVEVGPSFGVGRDDAAEIVQHVRSGLVEAFDAAHSAVIGTRVSTPADAVARGVKQLPLVVA